MTFKLNDPSIKAAYEARRELFRARARQAMQAEGLSDATDEIVNQLADIAVVLESSNSGSPDDPVAQTKRAVLGVLNKITDDGQRIDRALRELNNALDDCSESTRIEIVAGLKDAGVDPDSLSAGLDAMQVLAHGLGREHKRKIERGNVMSTRAVAIRNVLTALDPTGLGLRARSRVIGQLLDGGDAKSGNIYSAIHEIRAKG